MVFPFCRRNRVEYRHAALPVLPMSGPAKRRSVIFAQAGRRPCVMRCAPDDFDPEFVGVDRDRTVQAGA
ncbi:hypothetical protein AU196_14455 [Mycobacterium sp. IS-1742]|nr:hypothetical protein AU196_14455 [Mycobacterium sp. IS-1742]